MVQVDEREVPRAAPILAAATALMIAIGAAGTGLLFPDVCRVCGDSQSPIPTLLGIGGGLTYCLSIVFLAFARTRVLAAVIVLIAAGFHVVLLKSMHDASAWCATCTVAGIAALISAGVLSLGRIVPLLLAWAGAFAGLAIGLAFAGMIVSANPPEEADTLPAEYAALLGDSKNSCRTQACRGCVVVFEREGCAACDVLKDASERGRVENEVGGKVCVIRKRAPDGVAVPTVVVHARGRWSVFRGAPDSQQLMAAFDP